MGSVGKIVFWQNIPSVHQSAVIRSLATIHDGKVIVITATGLPSGRSEMGWSLPVFAPAEQIIAPSIAKIRETILESSSQNDFHIFSGLYAYPALRQPFSRLLKTSAHIGVLAETADPRGLKGIVRRLVYRARTIRFRRRVDFFLCIGTRARRWYTRAGVPDKDQFLFGYFIETMLLDQFEPRPLAPFTFLFAGRLVRLKGVDILLKALGRLRNADWRLRIIGDGPEKKNLLGEAEAQGIADRIDWSPFEERSRVGLAMSRADCVVLPSRYDGWGAVVNEALMAGTPVICTDACGASDLIVSRKHGMVVRADDVADLENALALHLVAGAPDKASRKSLADWATRLTGLAGARYLLAILASLNSRQKPQPPWLRPGQAG